MTMPEMKRDRACLQALLAGARAGDSRRAGLRRSRFHAAHPTWPETSQTASARLYGSPPRGRDAPGRQDRLHGAAGDEAVRRDDLVDHLLRDRVVRRDDHHRLAVAGRRRRRRRARGRPRRRRC